MDTSEHEKAEDLSSRIQKMSEEELFEFALNRIQDSYENRRQPFHPTHKLVDLVWEECVHRDSTHLFNQAFHKI